MLFTYRHIIAVAWATRNRLMHGGLITWIMRIVGIELTTLGPWHTITWLTLIVGIELATLGS